MNSTDPKLGLERIVFFSDAVMAIAITLLALDLRVPELGAGPGQVAERLLELRPQLLIFLLSFAVIGIYWAAHHRYFGFVHRYDARLIALNLVFLFFVVCIPFVASLLGRYAPAPLAVAAYGSTVAALGLSLAAIWWYASSGRRLIVPDLDAATIREAKIRLLAGPIVFLVAV